MNLMDSDVLAELLGVGWLTLGDGTQYTSNDPYSRNVLNYLSFHEYDSYSVTMSVNSLTTRLPPTEHR